MKKFQRYAYNPVYEKDTNEFYFADEICSEKCERITIDEIFVTFISICVEIYCCFAR